MTTEQLLAFYARLPWTIVSRTEDGRTVAHVAEMPDAIADGVTDEELRVALDEAIRESLRVRLHAGDPLPSPHGVAVVVDAKRPVVQRLTTSRWSIDPADFVASQEAAWA